MDREIEAPGPTGSLRGQLLTVADKAAPLVLIVPGSGPTDRDGNNELGLSTDTYRLLAEALQAAGIASLRIDKRGFYGSAAAVDDPEDVTLAAYAQDLRSWIAVAQRELGRDCLWLAGHSEGGLVALKTAQRPEGICGLLLLAAPGRPVGTLLREQLAAYPANAPYLEQAFAAIDRLEAGETLPQGGLAAPLQALFRPGVQRFMIDLFSYDPAALARGYDGPALILQGGQDLQVKLADADLLAEALPQSRRVDLPGANHMLKAVPEGDLAANLAAYGDPSHPLAPGVAESLAAFVLETGNPD
ncbi:MAG: alpha/beta fold hydrolase [Rhodospirillales bacterium]